MHKSLLSGLSLLATGVVAAACSDDAAAGPFEIAVVIEGQGSVNSTPEGLDCTGPKACDEVAFEGKATLLLTPAPAVKIAAITVDDVAVEVADRLDVSGPAGSTRRVRITFEDIELGPGPARADAGTDAD